MWLCYIAFPLTSSALFPSSINDLPHHSLNHTNHRHMCLHFPSPGHRRLIPIFIMPNIYCFLLGVLAPLHVGIECLFLFIVSLLNSFPLSSSQPYGHYKSQDPAQIQPTSTSQTSISFQLSSSIPSLLQTFWRTTRSQISVPFTHLCLNTMASHKGSRSGSSSSSSSKKRSSSKSPDKKRNPDNANPLKIREKMKELQDDMQDTHRIINNLEEKLRRKEKRNRDMKALQGKEGTELEVALEKILYNAGDDLFK